MVISQVATFPGYYADMLGNIYNDKGRKLKPQVYSRPGKKDYYTITLMRDGKPHNVFVHRAVCLAWIGERPKELPMIRHLNDIGTDNRPENLVYGTNSDNSIDSVINGTHAMARRTECNNGHDWTNPDNYSVLKERKSNGRVVNRRRCKLCRRK